MNLLINLFAFWSVLAAPVVWRDLPGELTTANGFIRVEGRGKVSVVGVGVGELVGRDGSGALSGLSRAEVISSLAVADVPPASLGASMLISTTADVLDWRQIPEARLVGRLAGDLYPGPITAAETRTMLGVQPVEVNSILQGGASGPAWLSVGASTLVGRTSIGNVGALTASQARQIVRTPGVTLINAMSTPTYTISSSDEVVLMSAAGLAGLALTLPAASDVGVGFRYWYGDGSGSAGPGNDVILNAAAGDQINGALVDTISTPRQVETAIVIDATPGAGHWLAF